MTERFPHKRKIRNLRVMWTEKVTYKFEVDRSGKRTLENLKDRRPLWDIKTTEKKELESAGRVWTMSGDAMRETLSLKTAETGENLRRMIPDVCNRPWHLWKKSSIMIISFFSTAFEIAVNSQDVHQYCNHCKLSYEESNWSKHFYTPARIPRIQWGS